MSMYTYNATGLTRTIKLQAVDGDGKPDGTDIATGTIQFTASASWRTVTFTKYFFLKANTQYAIVIDLEHVNDQVWYDNTGPSYTGGNYLSSGDSGSTWTHDTGKDFLFRILGQSVSPYLLFTKAFTSDPETENAVTQVDFEIPINTTNTIKGNCLLNVSTSGQTDMKAEIFRVRKGTELSLGSTTTIVDTARKCIIINLAQTPITKGDTLRLSINSASGIFNINYSDSGNELELYVPFKVNL